MAADSSTRCSSWLLMLVISVVASSMLQLQPVGARTTGPVTKSLDPPTDGSAVIHAPSQTPFAHFLHALFATATSKEEPAEDHEMPNEIPLIPQQQQQPQRQINEDGGVHSFEDTTLMFPRMVYKRAGRPLCGRFLVDALQLACGEGLGYQTLFQPTGKRSGKFAKTLDKVVELKLFRPGLSRTEFALSP